MVERAEMGRAAADEGWHGHVVERFEGRCRGLVLGHENDEMGLPSCVLCSYCESVGLLLFVKLNLI